MPKLLVIRRNRLGDAISVLPWLQGLKESRPELDIDVITNPYAAPVFERCGVVREVFILPEKYLGTPLGVLLHPTFRRLRNAKPYDFVVSASYSFSEKASLLAYFVPGREKIGVVSPHGKFVDRVWTRPVSQTAEIQACHQVQRVAYIGSMAGLHAGTLPPARLNMGKEKTNVVALCPVVNRPESKWSEVHWLELEQALILMGFGLVWLGARPTRADSELIRPHTTAAFLDVMSSFKMVICSEGGTSHIAPAFGIPTIVLSGKAIRNTWMPWNKNAVLLENEDVNVFTAEDVVEQIEHWYQHAEFKEKVDVYLNPFIS